MRFAFSYIIAIVCLWSSCGNRQTDGAFSQTGAATQYSSLLEMQDVDDDCVFCRIMNPWQPNRVAMQYLLVESKSGKGSEPKSNTEDKKIQKLEESYGPFQMLNVPLDRQAITSSCHLWLLNQLKATNSVSVVCDAEYIMLPEVKEALDNGTMTDGGSSMAPNAEILKEAGSSCIWISPYEANSQLMMLAQLPDLPIIYCADYMESDPLARAEWMRFYGRLVGKGYQADSLFDVVEKSYNTLCQPTKATTDGQDRAVKLLTDLPYGATWYVPGGRSTLGQMYQDAGFLYPWSEDTHGGSLSLSPEAVFERCNDADIWLFKHYDASQGDFSREWLLAQNPLFGQMKAAQTGKVYGCNTAHSDYFDATPFRPDLLLKELQNLKDGKEDSLLYFVKLKE